VSIGEASWGGSTGTVLVENPNMTTLTFKEPPQLLANAFWGGSAWLRPNQGAGAGYAQFDASGRLLVSQANAGANPISWATNLLLDADGSLQWAGGAPIKRHLSQAFFLNLAAPGSPGCVDSPPQQVPGASVGDTLSAGLSVALPARQQLSAIATGGGVVFRVCQFSGPATDPDGGGATYRVDVWKH
jgi:hypothetical protein